MKQFVIFLFLTLLTTISSFSQRCNCKISISEVEQQYEKNLASYQYQVIELHGEKEYLKFKHTIDSIAALIHKQKDCIGLLSRYMSYFKDAHLFINYNEDYFPFKTLQDSQKVKKFFKKDPVIKPHNQLSINKKLEGIWYFQDASFSINIVPDKSYNREWAGLIEKEDGYLYSKGQLKIEIFINPDSSLSCVYWRGSRQPKCFPLTLTDSTLSVGRTYTFYRKENQAIKSRFELTDKISFTSLSSKTNYLRIPSFDLSNESIIDSLIEANLLKLKEKPNLIIDVRNNGGGGDPSYYPLIPLIFDSNVLPETIIPSIWVSKDNFDYYKSTEYMDITTKQDSINSEIEMKELENYIGKFTPVEFKNDTIDSVYYFPKHVGIITNRSCASTTEGFVSLAKESPKVLQFGENTGGFISYGDWRKIVVPGLPVWISMTTKKMYFRNNKEIETIGIEPNIALNPNNENLWIEQTMKYLEQ